MYGDEKNYSIPHRVILFAVTLIYASGRGRGSVIGRATRYGLQSLWFEFRWERYVPCPSRRSILQNG